MYKIEIKGCLIISLILFFIIFALLKLWYLVVLVVLVFIFRDYINTVKINIKEKEREKEINYEPEMGEVYKICPYCGQKVKHSQMKCPNCNNDLE